MRSWKPLENAKLRRFFLRLQGNRKTPIGEDLAKGRVMKTDTEAHKRNLIHYAWEQHLRSDYQWNWDHGPLRYPLRRSSYITQVSDETPIAEFDSIVTFTRQFGYYSGQPSFRVVGEFKGVKEAVQLTLIKGDHDQ